MKIVDTFLFSEAYEAEQLLIKLHLESPVVSAFVLIESDCTFRGDYKGFQARALVNSDSRFAPFRGKIVFVEHVGRPFDGPPSYETFYENEERSRELALDYISRYCDSSDWILVSDVDEALDATDERRVNTFLAAIQDKCNTNSTLYFGHYRYWWDFDNRCSWEGVFTPAVRVGTIEAGKSSLRCRSVSPDVGLRKEILPSVTGPLFFEYTFCFPKEACWKKLNSFIHDGYTKEELERALLANHWIKAAARGEKPGDRKAEDWFELVELTPDNSSAYVRNNLASLRTGLVPENYRTNRQRLYGDVGNWPTSWT